MEKKTSLIHIVVDEGDAEIANALLETPSLSFDWTEKKGLLETTPLGAVLEQVKWVLELSKLKEGKKVSFEEKERRRGYAKAAAEWSRVAKKMIKMGASPFVPCEKSGETGIEKAFAIGAVAAVAAAFETNESLTEAAARKTIPLALMSERFETLSFALRKKWLDKTDAEKLLPECRSKEQAEVMILAGASPSEEIETYFEERKNNDIAALIRTKRCSAESSRGKGEALCIAAEKGETQKTKRLAREAGAEAKGENGETPLARALLAGAIETAVILIENGASPRTLSKGVPSIFYALGVRQEHVKEFHKNPQWAVIEHLFENVSAEEEVVKEGGSIEWAKAIVSNLTEAWRPNENLLGIILTGAEEPKERIKTLLKLGCPSGRLGVACEAVGFSSSLLDPSGYFMFGAGAARRFWNGVDLDEKDKLGRSEMHARIADLEKETNCGIWDVEQLLSDLEREGRTKEEAWHSDFSGIGPARLLGRLMERATKRTSDFQMTLKQTAMMEECEKMGGKLASLEFLVGTMEETALLGKLVGARSLDYLPEIMEFAREAGKKDLREPFALKEERAALTRKYGEMAASMLEAFNLSSACKERTPKKARKQI